MEKKQNFKGKYLLSVLHLVLDFYLPVCISYSNVNSSLTHRIITRSHTGIRRVPFHYPPYSSSVSTLCNPCNKIRYTGMIRLYLLSLLHMVHQGQKPYRVPGDC